MSGRNIASNELQVKSFIFNNENLKKANEHIKKYPESRESSAVLALLHLAQDQEGWVPRAAIAYIADMLNMHFMHVYEVASFYSMFNLSPVGKYHIQLCGTTPCWLCGSDDLKNVIKNKLGISINETTMDQMFTVTEVECLGACANAPMVQINNDYYEDLNVENFSLLLDNLINGKPIKTGSQIGRKCSEPKDKNNA